jgi:tagatose-1,6-bisphosphate aldolase non-catalytic subunit AgaZ/GatZ
MNNISVMFPETKPDLLAALFQQIITMAPGFSAALAHQIEAEFRAKHAGENFVILKRGPRMTADQRAAVYRDGLTAMENDEIVQKHKISRRTLYRVMKDGGGRFSG